MFITSACLLEQPHSLAVQRQQPCMPYSESCLILSACCAEMYEHVREETGRPAPPRPVQAARTPSAQLPVAAAIAAYTPSSTPAAAPTPSYQEYESESEDSEAVLDTPGQASHTPHHGHHQ